ncbi:MAG: response regulator transcription factor [Ardenticatenaceae bacterium]|nr:response regulator transcription factor [Ardenticatenaceae bacterium]
MINVIIADDHNLVREGIRALLEKAEDITVIGEAENGEQALELVQAKQPDVLVMDIAMPGMNGIQVLEKLRELDLPTQVVILSMYADEIFVRQALQNGAKGYLLKGSFKEELLLTIRAASRGATYLSPSVSESVLTPPSSSSPSPADQLTPREHELLQLIAKGHTNAEIADIMNVSIKTVERHRTNLMTKLDARNIVELIRVAVRYRLIVLDD